VQRILSRKFKKEWNFEGLEHYLEMKYAWRIQCLQSVWTTYNVYHQMIRALQHNKLKINCVRVTEMWWCCASIFLASVYELNFQFIVCSTLLFYFYCVLQTFLLVLSVACVRFLVLTVVKIKIMILYHEDGSSGFIWTVGTAESKCSWLTGADKTAMNIQTYFQFKVLFCLKNLWSNSNKKIKLPEVAWNLIFNKMQTLFRSLKYMKWLRFSLIP
jgi:hypothetical protein